MPFNIVRDDITHMQVDAIVNAANNQLQHGGGVCGAIFRAAGARRLQAACDEIGHCETGQAVATSGYDLPARYVIHTVGPIWQGGTASERELLASCYRTSLELAATLKCRSIAFPLISSGIYGYPKREALAVAQEEIRAFLETHEMEVTLVLFDRHAVEIADDLRIRVARYIDDVYVGDYPTEEEHRRKQSLWQDMGFPKPGAHGAARETTAQGDAAQAGAYAAAEAAEADEGSYTFGDMDWLACAQEALDDTGGAPSEGPEAPGAGADAAASYAAPSYGAASAPAAPAPGELAGTPTAAAYGAPTAPAAPAHPKPSPNPVVSRLPRPLRRLLNQMDAGFSDTLMALIDERGLKDAEVYRRANLSRQHFSKIRSNPRYQPKKTTVLALAVALRLSLEETSTLLERAGFAFSHADRRDIIVEFFIREGNYDVFEINDALFAFDQPLLG